MCSAGWSLKSHRSNSYFTRHCGKLEAVGLGQEDAEGKCTLLVCGIIPSLFLEIILFSLFHRKNSVRMLYWVWFILFGQLNDAISIFTPVEVFTPVSDLLKELLMSAPGVFTPTIRRVLLISLFMLEFLCFLQSKDGNIQSFSNLDASTSSLFFTTGAWINYCPGR